MERALLRGRRLKERRARAGPGRIRTRDLDEAPSVEMQEIFEALPPSLRERARRLDDRAVRAGRYVLYWMRAALRADENPALEAALTLSRALDLPVFVYQGLSERYPYASDRHHWFILQGARDVAVALARRDIGYALHVEREGQRGPHLIELAEEAAAVVTEDLPVKPLRPWTESLAARVECPVMAVDTACVVPMQLTPWPFERAYEFRRATAELRRERVGVEWPALEPGRPAFLPDLPFEPVDPSSVDLADLIGRCRIDHGVAPVAHSRGGSVAGWERWRRFRDEGLRQYRRRRNDPLADGVSRLSPYLHYGMVSPFRIAREAAAEGSPGADKFLDELLVWRELAYAFCFHQPRHDRVEALPDWARETLAAHETDARPALFSWERLARAQTGDPLWDAAQTHLLRHGELHNNVRMTWGKAVLSWTRDAAEALRLVEDLNHRYALDGRDPSSYGGILWCLGLFDRPFPPERPILGTVRPRPTEAHARRIDLDRYRAKTAAPPIPEPPRVLVIGGGVAGLACARTLEDAGFPATVLDKGRGPGGRVSTRRIGTTAFDHGAQYFTARDGRFRTWVEAWKQEGVVAPWEGRIGTLEAGSLGATRGSTERFVGVPGMSSLGRHLASGLEVHQARRVVALEREEGRWRARCEDGSEHRGEIAVLALPPPQALELAPAGSEVAERLAEVRMTPCWAVMVELHEPLDLDLDGAFVRDSPLSWVARNGSKPGRPSPESWVLHATPEWSVRHLDLDGEEVAPLLLEALAAAAGIDVPPVATAMAHRWRYAMAADRDETRDSDELAEGLDDEFLHDGERGLGVCGDCWLGGRVEGAFLSGVALAGAILRHAVGGRAPEARTGGASAASARTK